MQARRCSAAEQDRRDGVKTAFQNTCAGVNPGFKKHNVECLWRLACQYYQKLVFRDNAAEGGAGKHNTSPITVQSAKAAKELIQHLETQFAGLFHPANGGMLINLGNHLDTEQCRAIWLSQSGVMRIDGVLFKGFLEFQKFWESSSSACLSVQVDVQEAKKLGIDPYAYSCESAGQLRGFKHEGVDMYESGEDRWWLESPSEPSTLSQQSCPCKETPKPCSGATHALPASHFLSMAR